jgi:hypothetical protein
VERLSAQATLDDAHFKQLTALRNFLTHRGTPARLHSLSTGEQDIPSAIPSNLADLASRWRYDFHLSPQCLVPYKVWLENSLAELIRAASAFTSTRL